MPDYWPTVFAAQFWGVPPWVMAEQPVYWIQVAEDVAKAQQHVRDVEQRKRDRAAARAKR